MKIQSNHNSITFNAGLTSKMKSEIAHCDINKITKELAKSGISADFKNNKAVAWCSIKGIEIIKELNKKFNLNLAFPRGIYVEDFNNLLISDKMSAGFYNIEPKKIRLIYPGKNKEANILLIEGKKNGKKGLKILPPLYSHNKDGSYTEEIQKYFK